MKTSNFFIFLLAVMACSQVVDGRCNDCKIKYKAVGCYKDLKHYHVLRKYSPKYDSWSDWKTFMVRSACRCATLAKKHKKTAFGITFLGSKSTKNGYQFDGECRILNSYSKLHMVPDDQCLRYCYKPCTKKSNPCIGSGNTTFIYQIVEAPSCDIPLERLGCYADKHKKGARPLPHYYLTDRDSSRKDIFSGRSIDWRNWDVYMPELICRCAKKARKMGRTVFGVQYYGECWTGKKGHLTFNKDGKSKYCVNKCFRPCRPNQKYCVGQKNTNFVYRIRAY